MMKKILAVLSVAALVFSCGCASKKYNAENVQVVASKTADAETAEKISSPTEETSAPSEENNTTTAAPNEDEDQTPAGGETTISSDAAGEKKTGESGTKKTESKKTPTKKDSGTVTIKGTRLKIGMTVTDSVVKSLGTTTDIQNAPSCHFDGNDTIYCYNGFSVYTYADNGVNKLYLVEIDGSGVSTDLGVRVGSSKADVEALYGQPSSQTGTSAVYKYGSSLIRFSFSGGSVSLIEYEEA